LHRGSWVADVKLLAMSAAKFSISKRRIQRSIVGRTRVIDNPGQFAILKSRVDRFEPSKLLDDLFGDL
jgi:hypothetical protein